MAGAYWNYGQNFGGNPGESPTEHAGGEGAFGKWGVESVEPSGEEYDDGKREAEAAFIASRPSPEGDADEAEEGYGVASVTPTEAPWLEDGGASTRGAFGDAGGYLGAGETGSAGAHRSYEQNTDGQR
jgi:hypothetical protein